MLGSRNNNQCVGRMICASPHSTVVMSCFSQVLKKNFTIPRHKWTRGCSAISSGKFIVRHKMRSKHLPHRSVYFGLILIQQGSCEIRPKDAKKKCTNNNMEGCAETSLHFLHAMDASSTVLPPSWFFHFRYCRPLPSHIFRPVFRFLIFVFAEIKNWVSVLELVFACSFL